MKDRKPELLPGSGLRAQVVALALRIAALLAVIGTGWLVYSYLGGQWFQVYFLVVAALRLEIEIRWILKNVPPDDGPRDAPPPNDNPFPKR